MRLSIKTMGLIATTLLLVAESAQAVPITREYSYLGAPVPSKNRITGSFTLTRGSFENHSIDLASFPCLRPACGWFLSNGVGQNTNWSPSTIGFGSVFKLAFDPNGTLARWNVFVGSGPNALQARSDTGDAVYEISGIVRNFTPGVWTLVSETGGTPPPMPNPTAVAEPGTFALMLFGMLGLTALRRREAKARRL